LIVVVSDTLAETVEFIFEDFDVENTPEGIAAYRANVVKEAENVDVDVFLTGQLAEYMGASEGTETL
jgi:hypothetical protein